jgi:FtsH-binding integral membrane protein
MEEFIKEARSFRRQMKWTSIMCWAATIIFVSMEKPNADYDWVIIQIGAVIFSIIYFQMNKNIKEYEKLKDDGRL